MSLQANLTAKQQRAVDTDEKRVLVSAAAGSGKTTVLAKRVASEIEKHADADIANMLVMTFTNAAAGEMKRRISKELKERAAAKRDARLKAQAERVEYAPISTYHSFCIKLLRENCAAAQVSPNFKLLDEAGTTGMMLEALREVFDMLYEADPSDPVRAGFLNLLSRFSVRGDDNRLEDIILSVYRTAMTKPNMREWLKKGLDTSSQKDERIRAMYESLAKKHITGFIRKWKKALEMTGRIDDEKFKAQHKADENAISLPLTEKLANEDIYKAYEYVRDFKKPTWVRGADKELKKPISDVRDSAADDLKQFISSPIFRKGLEDEIKEQQAHTHKDVEALAEIVMLFDKAYSVKKKERNAVDFDEALQRALMVLKALKEDGSCYGSRFTHIFVDEFQDTNPVQSEILKLLMAGGASVFMVGDRKQCIYRFNNADPGIFKGVEQDIAENSDGEIIRMNDNFRSDKSVVDAVNSLMELIMSDELGEVEYDAGERLISGAGSGAKGAVQILLCKEPGADVQSDGEEKFENTSMAVISESAEADIIATHLAGVLGEEDGNGNKLFKPGDVAILLRKTGPLMPQLVRALERKGISAFIEAKSTQDSPEIDLFVNLLRIVKNPMQDIPLVSVMLSPIGGFTEDDLVNIRLEFKTQSVSRHGETQKAEVKERTIPFYTAAYKYKQTFDDDLSKKLADFYTDIDALNKLSRTYSLSDFIGYVAEKYSFDSFFSEVKNGNGKREAFYELLSQIDGMLPYTGNSLYELISALDAIKKKEGRFVKNTQVQKRPDSVRIMTMHNSKGLEFPVTYVAGLASGVNVKDLSASFLKDGDEGICAAHIDIGPNNTLVKQTSHEYEYMKEKAKSQRMSEELRLLYVAMTRAKQRLYLTGKVKEDEYAALDKWREDEGDYDVKNMLDLIMRANVNEKVIDYSFIQPNAGSMDKKPFDFNAHLKNVGEVQPADVIELNKPSTVQAKMAVSAVNRGKEGALRSLLSVYDEDLKRDYTHEAVEEGVPDVVGGGEIKGAALGTLMHRAIERMVKYNLDFKTVARDMLSRGLIDDAQYDACIKNEKLAEGFYTSPLYSKMRAAERLITEKRFFLKVAAQSIGIDSELPVTVQGGLDAAFLEDGQWVLVDYKTDGISESEIDGRAQMYKTQLDLYAKALKDIIGIPVKEKHLYFLRLNKDYVLPN